MIKNFTLVVAIVIAAVLAVSGCTAPVTNPTPSPTESQLKAFTDAYHNNVKKNLGTNETLRSWNETLQANNTMRVRYSTHNSTTSAFNKNGSTTNFDIKIQKFASTAEASTLVDDRNFGYTPVGQNNTATLNSSDLNEMYNTAMGHNPTTTTAYVKLDSLTFVAAQVSFIMQADEFVVYGSGSTLSGSASVSPSPTLSPSPSLKVTLTPTPSPTKKPTVTAKQSSAVAFVGSKNSKVYHYPTCPEALKIKAGNLVKFATLTDAKTAGYRPCQKCHPPS